MDVFRSVNLSFFFFCGCKFCQIFNITKLRNKIQSWVTKGARFALIFVGLTQIYCQKLFLFGGTQGAQLKDPRDPIFNGLGLGRLLLHLALLPTAQQQHPCQHCVRNHHQLPDTKHVLPGWGAAHLEAPPPPLLTHDITISQLSST